MNIHTDNEKECEEIFAQSLEENLNMESSDSVQKPLYDITAMGEILIDFTSQGYNENGQMLYARNPGALRPMLLWQLKNWEHRQPL